jgi:hypothetical protein
VERPTTRAHVAFTDFVGVLAEVERTSFNEIVGSRFPTVVGEVGEIDVEHIDTVVPNVVLNGV